MEGSVRTSGNHPTYYSNRTTLHVTRLKLYSRRESQASLNTSPVMNGIEMIGSEDLKQNETMNLKDSAVKYFHDDYYGQNGMKINNDI